LNIVLQISGIKGFHFVVKEMSKSHSKSNIFRKL